MNPVISIAIAIAGWFLLAKTRRARDKRKALRPVWPVAMIAVPHETDCCWRCRLRRLSRAIALMFRPIPTLIEHCARCHNPTIRGADHIGCCRSIDVCHGPSFPEGSCCVLRRSWS